MSMIEFFDSAGFIAAQFRLLDQRLSYFPEATRIEYLSRFNRAMNYRFLPTTLNYQPRRNQPLARRSQLLNSD